MVEKKELSPQSVGQLNFREIIEANRRENVGTVIDRSWKENQTNSYAEKGLTRKERLYSGGYSLPAILGFKNYTYNRRLQQIQYLQDNILNEEFGEGTKEKDVVDRLQAIWLKY